MLGAQCASVYAVYQNIPTTRKQSGPTAPRSTTTLLNPWEIGDPDQLVEFEFEDADLSSFIQYIQDRFEIKFILADDIQPMPKGGKNVLGTKVISKGHY